MRLVTFGFRGFTRAGAMLGDGEVVDLNRARAARLTAEGALDGQRRADAELPSDVRSILEGGDAALAAAREALEWAASHAQGDRDAARNGGIVYALDEPGFRLLAPIARPGKALAIGLNYKLHAEETGQALPPHPIVFTKLDTTLVGPGDPVEVPQASHRVDWEGEFCFVIGKPARHVAAADALSYVAGYMNGNDVSVRDWQAHAATWTMGKGFDTHGPTGPWILTSDECPDPSALTLRTWVNDVLKQESPTSDLIFDVPTLIEYITTGVTLMPGDIVFTGTPSGVGQARNPREWLAPGDTVRVEITGLGVLENPVVAEGER